ncbi:C2 domain-containing protein, partial [Fomitopsis serialis]|uniref:C2 domain-containing protein n=1 Tax=Fomitopsis serialis TaxID=139415 RepID=UPI00200885B4
MEIGTLVVVVLKARNLPDRHSLYKQDVLSQVAIGGSTKSTKVDVKGGQHPVWDEELRFPIYQKTKQADRTMEVSCWRKEPRGVECIGKGAVDIEETLRTGEFDDWVKLEENGTYRGELYLEMTYFATGPAPLQRRKTKMPTSERLVRSSQ